jgi:hypothetical protein
VPLELDELLELELLLLVELLVEDELEELVEPVVELDEELEELELLLDEEPMPPEPMQPGAIKLPS